MINKLQKQLNKLWHEQINYDMKEIIEEFDKKKKWNTYLLLRIYIPLRLEGNGVGYFSPLHV